MAVTDAHPQRSPYAGSANRFRGLPINLQPAIVPTTAASVTTSSAVSPTAISAASSPAASVTVGVSTVTAASPTEASRTISAGSPTAASRITTSAIPRPQSRAPVFTDRLSESDFDQDYDQYREDYQDHRHHQQGGWRNNRRERHFDYGFF